MEPSVLKSWSLSLPQSSEPVQACTRIALSCFIHSFVTSVLDEVRDHLRTSATLSLPATEYEAEFHKLWRR
jgi:hypothetical protein